MTLVPDLAVPIAGWRIWDVVDVGLGPELVSPVRPLPWRHRAPTTAACAVGCDPCPSADCRCGLYATAGLEPLPLEDRGGPSVLGCTALWGRVVEHTDGWRGEHGYPLVLFVISALPVERTGRASRIRRLGPRPPDDGPDEPEDLDRIEELSRELARLYAVPALPAPSLSQARARHRSWVAGAAAALRAEAADGLAGRRVGDQAVQDRLTRRVQDLLDACDL